MEKCPDNLQKWLLTELLTQEYIDTKGLRFRSIPDLRDLPYDYTDESSMIISAVSNHCFSAHFVVGTIESRLLYKFIGGKYLGKDINAEEIELIDNGKELLAWLSFDYININGRVHCENVRLSPLLAAEEKWARHHKLTDFSFDEFTRRQNYYASLLNSYYKLEEVLRAVFSEYVKYVRSLSNRIADYLGGKDLEELVGSEKGTKWYESLKRFSYSVNPVRILESDESAKEYFCSVIRGKRRNNSGIPDDYSLHIEFGKSDDVLDFEYKDDEFYLVKNGEKRKRSGKSSLSGTIIKKYADFYKEIDVSDPDLSSDDVDELYDVRITLKYADSRSPENKKQFGLYSVKPVDDNAGITSHYLSDLLMFKKLLEDSRYGKTEYEKKVIDLISSNSDTRRIDISGNGSEKVTELFRKTLKPSCAPCGRYPSDYDPYLMQQLAINLSGRYDTKLMTVNGPPGTGKSTLLKEIIADEITKKALKLARKLKSNSYRPDELFNEDMSLKTEHEDLFDYSILILSGNNMAVENIVKDFADGLKTLLPKGQLPCVGMLGKKGNLEEYRNICDIKAYCTEETETDSIKECTESFLAAYRLLKKRSSKQKHKKECNDLISDYFSDDDEKYLNAQKSNPGIKGHRAFNDDRQRLFISALGLISSFAKHSYCIQQNFKEVLDAVYYGYKPECNEERLKTLYNSLFFVSPVISSTFASIARTYKHLTIPSSLGIMVVDEAGQISPEVAVGALYRTQKAIIVGDPKQILPVIDSPKRFAQEIARKLAGEDDDDPYKNPSLQSEADKINPYGTYIGFDWVGCPLVLHSRCISPMFDISNTISYGETMLKNTKEPSVKKAREFIFDNSYWIRATGSIDKGFGLKNHFVQRHAEIVKRLILEKFHNCRRDLELKENKGRAVCRFKGEDLSKLLFVITPFKTVAEGLKNYLNKYLKNRLRSGLFAEGKEQNLELYALKEWLKCNCIGTIHTFQGREADEVILSLGCSKDTPKRVLDFIGDNMVNVAVSRAKYRLYIVGDLRLWNKKGNNPVKTAYEFIGKENTICLRTKNRKKLEDLLGFKDFLYYREHGKLMPEKIELKLTGGKERKHYPCPECKSTIKYGKYGWYCPNRSCNMKFRIDGSPLNTAALESLMNSQDITFDPHPYSDKYYKVYPALITKQLKRNKEVTVYDSEPIARKSRITKKKSKDQKMLLSNCSSKIWEERKKENTDYFDFMVQDAIYTIRSKHKGDKEFEFTVMDILRLLSGDENVNYNSSMREIILETVKRLDCSNDGYLRINNLEFIGKEKFRYTNNKANETLVFKGADNQNRYLSLPVEALGGIDANGKAIFPVKEEWLKLKHYLVYRIALIYRMKKVKNRISFNELNSTINLDFNESDRMKKKRFRQNLEKYLSFLKETGYIYGYEIKESGKNDGYFGISYIDINPLNIKERTEA